MLDNPIMFMLGLSLGLMIGGALALVIATLFPYNSHKHATLWEIGYLIAKWGFYIFIGGALLFCVWSIIVLVLVAGAVIA